MLSSFTWSCDFRPSDCSNGFSGNTEDVEKESRKNLTTKGLDRDRQRRLERSVLAREHRGDSMLFFQSVLKKLSNILPVVETASSVPGIADSAISLAHFDQQLYPVPWTSIPLSLQPMGGFLPTNRIERKTRQVLRMVQLAATLILQLSREQHSRRLRIVEFCAGSGFVLLPLVAMFPQHEFVLIDMKEPSLDIARQRIALCGDTRLQRNVRIVSGLIQDYQETFDVGIALHACGSASDIALDK
jgi:hypothetical protein